MSFDCNLHMHCNQQKLRDGNIKNENVTLIKLRFEKIKYVLYYRLINCLLVVHIIHSTKFFII